MKLALALLAVLAVVAGSHIEQNEPRYCSANLEEEWIQYVALIPRGEILNIVITHLATDEEVQNMVLYLVSDEFEAIVVELDAEQDFINLLDYLESICVHMYNFLNAIHEFLGLPPIVQIVPTTTADVDDVAGEEPQRMFTLQKLREIVGHFKKHVKSAQGKSGQETRTWDSMWDELAAVWPKEEMQALHQELLATSADYQKLFDGLSAQECYDLVQKVIVLPSWVTFMEDLRAGGVDVDRIQAWIQRLLGWTESTTPASQQFIQ